MLRASKKNYVNEGRAAGHLRRKKELLLCGGAVGHLQHLAENLELTFGEIKDVITSAAEGKLEKVSEKLDGMNLVFTYDVNSEQLKTARNGSDIKTGGMDASALAKKFFGRGNVELAFNSAFKVLNDSLSALPPPARKKIFGPRGNRWYSIEIIYAPDPNTINYDTNNIVFHGWPIFKVDSDGTISQDDDDSGITLLTSKIEQMQRALSMKDWRIRGPSLLNLKQLSDGTIARSAIEKIEAAQAAAGVDDNATIYDYLRSLLRDEISNYKMSPELKAACIERAIEAPGAPGIPQLKKMSKTPSDAAAAVEFVKASEVMVKNMMLPIESAINEFAIGVLNGVSSTLIAKSDEEVSRIKAQVNKAISAIKASGNVAAMEILQKEMNRLGSVDNINAAMEGIVFFYKGNAYKFTGAFAPVHQILSLFKYGRKGIPKMDLGESRFIVEGGHAFDSVRPISIEDFKAIWPTLVQDLQDMGCKNVAPVGSTGKKPIMGDIDVAVEFDGTREELFSYVSDMFGAESVDKVGSNIISISYPLSGTSSGVNVQVDVMIGNVSYLTWSRFGTSPTKGHKDYSGVKGVVRNILLNVINRFASTLEFRDATQDDLDRTRYVVDFDKGLYKVVQTKRGKDPKKPLKDWKTLSREFVTDDPNTITTVMFGKGFKSSDIAKFEDLVEVLRRSKLRAMADKILSAFVVEVREQAAQRPEMFGDNVNAMLNYVKSVVGL